MDFGVKWNLLRSLAHFGCEIEVVPASMKAADILAKKPDGIFLSNGPGDPSAAPYAAETVKQLVGKVPLFGGTPATHDGTFPAEALAIRHANKSYSMLQATVTLAGGRSRGTYRGRILGGGTGHGTFSC